MVNELYLGTLDYRNNQNYSKIHKVRIRFENDDMYAIDSNITKRERIRKVLLNVNLKHRFDFVMFSESKEFLIEQMREYVSVEIEKSNKRISDLQSSFERVLSEINTN